MRRRLPNLEVRLPRHIFDTGSFIAGLVERTEAVSSEVLEHRKQSRTFHGCVFLQHL
jgi:hypothetical protein